MGTKLLVGYLWFMSLLGTAFYTHEFFMMRKDKEIAHLAFKNRQCNLILGHIKL